MRARFDFDAFDATIAQALATNAIFDWFASWGDDTPPSWPDAPPDMGVPAFIPEPITPMGELRELVLA